MATPVYRYPLDPTGTNPDNHVIREPHELNPKTNNTDVRVACPLYGPFYAKSVVILDASNGRELIRDVDYKETDLLQDPTLKFGQEVSQFIVITNGSVSNSIEISYQVLGGNYQNDATAVQHVFETFLNDTRPVDWTNVGGKPATYPPSLHLHLLQDIINFGPVVVAIDSLRDSKMLNNTPMFEALIQWIKDYKVEWTDIVNRPQNVLNIFANVVTTDDIQTITAKKTFKLVSLGTGSTAVSTVSGKEAAIATIEDIEEVAVSGVPNGRLVSTPEGSGLMGGGELSQDLSLSLTPTGVVAQTYGSAGSYPNIRVDEHGRITFAEEQTLIVQFSDVVNTPTTVEDYGITDAVDTFSDQTVAGVKSFVKAVLEFGSIATDIDKPGHMEPNPNDPESPIWVPPEQTPVVSLGYLDRRDFVDKPTLEEILKSFLGSEQPVDGVSVIRLGPIVIQYGYGANVSWWMGSYSFPVAKLAVPMQRLIGIDSLLPTGYADSPTTYNPAPTKIAAVESRSNPNWPWGQYPAIWDPGSGPINFICRSQYAATYQNNGPEGSSTINGGGPQAVGMGGFWVVIGIPMPEPTP